MADTRKAINIICLLGLLLALFLRILADNQTIFGHTGARWSLLLGIAIIAIKLLAMAAEAAAGRILWPRLLLPGVLLVESLRVASGTASRTQAGIVVALLEMGLMAFAAVFIYLRKREFQAATYSEDFLESIFAQFLPEKLARFMANELVLYWSGARWCLGGFRLQSPPGFSYMGESLVAYLPVILPLLVLFESAGYELLMHGHPVLRASLLLLDAAALLWSFGMYATMKARPHQLSPELVRLNCGLLGRCEFPPELLLDVQAQAGDLVPTKEVGRLFLKNTSMLQLQLRRPVPVRKLFGADKNVDRILVSADDPAGFRAALLALKAQDKASVSAN